MTGVPATTEFVMPSGLHVQVTDIVGPPQEHLPEFFALVARNRVQLGVPDSKVLADCELTRPPADIQKELADLGDGLTPHTAYAVWLRSTRMPDYVDRLAQTPQPESGVTLSEYIKGKWADLTYHVKEDKGTLIGTEHPHLKSGVRYKEGYYWDIADAIDGLVEEAQTDPSKWGLIFGVLRNFATRIERNSERLGTPEEGFIENGMRLYYNSRSQPPKFVGMVKRVAEFFPDAVEEFLPAIVKEYNWWMKGAKDLDGRKGVYASDHTVLMPDGSVLNRYWDTRDDPRPEGYWEDVRAAALNPKVPAPLVYRRQRIMGETGRDFTGQYCEDPERVETAYPDRIVPVDLNSLLWEYEDFIAAAHERAGRSVLARQAGEARDARAAAMNKYQWFGDEQTGFYSDFLFDPRFEQGAPTGISSMTMAYAASRGLSPKERARSTVRNMNAKHLKRWGYVATLLLVEHQWDPNAWAPDQNEADKANERVAALTGDIHWERQRQIARPRWVGAHARIYNQTGKIVEKNHASNADPLSVVNGEYVMDDGFLWTNAVIRRFMAREVQCPTLIVVRTGQSHLLHTTR